MRGAGPQFKSGAGSAAEQQPGGAEQVVKLVPEQQEDFHAGSGAGYLPDSGSQEVRTLSAQLL
jgi:hypothetical protein